MAIKHVVTRGYGFADGTKYIPTRGYSSGSAPPVVVTGGPPTGASMAVFDPFRIEYIPPFSEDEAMLALAYWVMNDD